MLSPKEEYKFNKDVNNIKDIAYFELFEKYLIQNKKEKRNLPKLNPQIKKVLL